MISIADLTNAGRGFLMGGADIIPGVSGGTVALILGIYERLVTAISRVDLALLGLLRRGEWSAAAGHVDLRFLITLFVGVGCGIGGLASLMHWLLEHHLGFTFAAFFGLILASSLLVARMVGRWAFGTLAAAVCGAGFAFWLVGVDALQTPPEGLGYVLLCGMIAICAMILPGISGAFILLIMGMYADITGILRGLLHGDVTGHAIATVGTFIAGATVGLIAFSKLLRWLLAHHHGLTLALLAGFMLGSLRKIWPFKLDLTPAETQFKFKLFENTWPDWSVSATWIAILLTAAAGGAVILLDRISGSADKTPEEPGPSTGHC